MMVFNYARNEFHSDLKPLEAICELERQVDFEQVFKKGFSNYNLKITHRDEREVHCWLVPNLTRRIFIRMSIEQEQSGSRLILFYFPSVYFTIIFIIFFMLSVLFCADIIFAMVICLGSVFIVVHALLYANKDINKLLEIVKAKVA